MKNEQDKETCERFLYVLNELCNGMAENKSSLKGTASIGEMHIKGTDLQIQLSLVSKKAGWVEEEHVNYFDEIFPSEKAEA